MAKVHLQRNKGLDGHPPIAVCAGKSINGKIYLNDRRTYSYMASEIVRREEFKNVAPEMRCAHCVNGGLEIRNRQRREKGLEPVASLFD